MAGRLACLIESECNWEYVQGVLAKMEMFVDARQMRLDEGRTENRYFGHVLIKIFSFRETDLLSTFYGASILVQNKLCHCFIAFRIR